MRRLLESLGYAPRLDGRSFTICRGEAVATREALALVGLLQQRYPRNPAVLLGGAEPLAVGALPQRLYRLAAPLAWKRACRRLLKRSHTRMLIVAGALAQAPEVLIAQAHRLGCSIVVLIGAGAQEREDEALRRAAWAPLVDLVLPVDSDTGERRDLLERLDPLITPSRRQVARQRGKLPKHAGRLAWLQRSFLRPLLEFKFRGYPTIEALRTALGTPQTILCLGNGPSSEDPRLLEAVYDSLFRVNVSWKARDFLKGVEPDLVFTVIPQAIEKLRPRVGFVFKTLEDETTMLSRYLLRPRRLAFAIAERLGVYDRPAFGHFAPTNGAVMLAVAVALRPRRIIVAGMDLFSHPDGAYPGDRGTVNDYTMGHEKQLESAFIVEVLRRFRGELEILSPALRTLLEQPRRPVAAQRPALS